jgi:hypothetical protein
MKYGKKKRRNMKGKGERDVGKKHGSKKSGVKIMQKEEGAGGKKVR